MGVERRRFKRYDVTGVEGTLILNLDVKVNDLSLTGMSVETSSALHPGSSYTIRIHRDDGDLRFPAVARWCRLVRTENTPRGDTVPVYRSGLDFRDSLDEKARWILDFIEQHIVVEVDWRRRVAGRFTVAADGELGVVSSGEFVVRKLSLAGMLIETAAAADPGVTLELEVRHERHAFTARARVANAAPAAEDGGVRLLGIELVDPSPAAAKAIGGLIEEAL